MQGHEWRSGWLWVVRNSSNFAFIHYTSTCSLAGVHCRRFPSLLSRESLPRHRLKYLWNKRCKQHTTNWVWYREGEKVATEAHVYITYYRRWDNSWRLVSVERHDIFITSTTNHNPCRSPSSPKTLQEDNICEDTVQELVGKMWVCLVTIRYMLSVEDSEVEWSPNPSNLMRANLARDFDFSKCFTPRIW